MRLFLILVLLSPFLAFAQSEFVTGAATTTEVYEKVAEAASFLSTTGDTGIKELKTQRQICLEENPCCGDQVY